MAKQRLRKKDRILMGGSYINKPPKYMPDPKHEHTLEEKKRIRRGNRKFNI